MTPKPQRRISLQLRLILTIVFVAFAYFVAQYRKSAPGTAPLPRDAYTGPLQEEDLPAEGANRFDWVPAFPGAEMENITSKVTRGQHSYGFSFRTQQDSDFVLAFYGDKLKQAGFKVDIKSTESRGGELHAEGADGKRSFDVIAAKVYSGTGSEVGVTAVQR